MDIDEFDRNFFAHVGTPRHSGRYPYGSGENPNQRHIDFLTQVKELEKQGLTSAEIAKGVGLGEKGTAQLRARKSIANNELLKADQARAEQLKRKGMSTSAIGREMGRNESSVRQLLNPSAKEKANVLDNTSNFLRKQIEEKTYLDVSAGQEHYAAVSRTQLNHAIAVLKEEGYNVLTVKVPQLSGNKLTTTKVLAPPGDSKELFKDVINNQHKIQGIQGYTEDGGRTFLGIEKPIDVSAKRLEVRYGPEGGSDKDGIIELRRGVDDISLGSARYAQVRISVEGTHYLKGMAMYADDLPDGVDMRFNTNKSREESLAKGSLGALKPQKVDKSTGEVDADNPFGAIIRQKHYVDKDGNKKLSPINIVGSVDPLGVRVAGEEGGWSQWSKALSSQVLSKQSPALAKRQLDLTFKEKQDEYDEIMKLTNPTVKKKLLESFADGADSSAVTLKAAALPRQATHVILPINSMKETEIYAPNFRNGEKVALVRYPHGGKFEIPELIVNNRVPEANRLIPGAKDAVGINSKVAARLSGADFDGDTVLVIPNKNRDIKSEAPLKELKDFDPQVEYRKYEGMPEMSSTTKQHQMGNVSNLITDMTIKGATNSEIARAVRHSMVVIDAEKHDLDWRRSAKDHKIAELKKKYQGVAENGSVKGSATIISRASSELHVRERKQTVNIDPETGKKIYTETGNNYVIPAHTNINAKGKVTEVPEEVKYKLEKSTRLAEADDAYSLSSGTHIENVYAEHSNKLKALANDARKSYLQTPNLKLEPSARKAYAPQVVSLKHKLNVAQRNAPLERQANIIGGTVVKAKLQAEPDMDKAELKKLKSQALSEARIRLGAKKERIDITPEEWNAIQAGAISNNFLTEVLRNADLDKIKALATPRNIKEVSPAKIALAKARLASGYTQAEVADSVGISISKLNEALK